jgi:predicted nuclease of predicted toxin-antitoxin system
MRILCDHGVPAPLLSFLAGHTAVKAKDAGWDRLSNGELLSAAEAADFEVLITTDKNMRYQQSLAGRKIAVVILGKQQWPDVKPHVQRIVEIVEQAIPGSYAEVNIPYSRPSRPSA